jgi:hypothetical protein
MERSGIRALNDSALTVVLVVYAASSRYYQSIALEKLPEASVTSFGNCDRRSALLDRNLIRFLHRALIGPRRRMILPYQFYFLW